jgi:hypothetical protein
MKKQIKTVYIIQMEDAQDFFTGPFMDVISYCERFLRRSIPKEHQPAAKIACYRGYDDRFFVDIYYERYETDEEAEERIQTEIERLNDIRAKELQMIAEFKAKYESDTKR